jgi:branched-chain amino acid transport system ATP-binding protein
VPVVLEIHALSVAYGAVEALSDVSFDVHAGEVVTILGANGAGKSSLLHAIAGLANVTSGSISLDGVRITGMPAEKIARGGIGLVPEGRRIFTRLSVQENLALGGYFLSAGEARNRMEEMMAIFPILKTRRHSYAGHMSGGEQQMLAIARALMSRPRVLLLDEPSAGLSPIATASVYSSLKQYSRDSGVTMLLVEQNVKWALDLANRGHVLELGVIKLSGQSQELAKDERVASLYLGMEL